MKKITLYFIVVNQKKKIIMNATVKKNCNEEFMIISVFIKCKIKNKDGSQIQENPNHILQKYYLFSLHSFKKEILLFNHRESVCPYNLMRSNHSETHLNPLSIPENKIK